MLVVNDYRLAVLIKKAGVNIPPVFGFRTERWHSIIISLLGVGVCCHDGPESTGRFFVKRKYDTTFIIDGDLGQKEREAIIKKFRDVLEKRGAEIERIVRWGMRTLAYAIKKKTRGYYVIYYYFAETNIIKDVERELRLNENVLRYMTVRFDGTHPAYVPDEGEPNGAPAQMASVSEETVIADDSVNSDSDDHDETLDTDELDLAEDDEADESENDDEKEEN
jgi:small subunit ribosomal protein S6